MSDTDKTRPGWVCDFFDGVLTHDHRRRDCRVQTFDQARRAARGQDRGHWARCERYRWVPAPCPLLRGHTACPLAGEGPCPGHRYRVFDDTLTCATCAQMGRDACCTRAVRETFEQGQRRHGGAAPAWFRSQLTHRPARRRAGAVLHAAARDYNAGYRAEDDGHPDLEDCWEPPVPSYRDAFWRWW